MDGPKPRESTDLWLSAMQAFLLSSSYPDGLGKLLHQERTSTTGNSKPCSLSKRRGEGQRQQDERVKGNSACWRPARMTGVRRSPTCCFIRLLQDSIHQFYVCRSPRELQEALFPLHECPGQRCKEPLIPASGTRWPCWSLSLSTAGGLAASPECRLVPPEELTRAPHYWSSCLAEGPGAGDVFRHHSGVQTQGPDQGHSGVRFHLSCLVKGLLCGC